MTITDLRFCSVCEKVHLFKTGGRMIRKKADHVGKAEKKEKGVVFIMLICLGYMAMVIVGRCDTTAQKVMLPLAACLIGAGFIWRLLLAIVAHVPMDSGETKASGLDAMPDIIYDTNNARAVWHKQGTYGDHVVYYGPNGDTVTFYQSDIEGANYKGFALN